jgi:hypothetical protein
MSRFASLLVLTPLLGCDDRLIQSDPGYACLVADEADLQAFEATSTTSLEADADATVVVVVSECSSGSVTWDNSCTATVDGTTILVTAVAESRTPRTQTNDCQFITVACPVGPLPAGSYEIAYGGATVPVDVPSSGEPACAVASPRAVPL